MPGGGKVKVEPLRGKYLKGEKVKITAIADEGWQFIGWGDYDSKEEYFEYTVEGDKTIIAQFGTPITTKALGGGSIGIKAHTDTLNTNMIPACPHELVHDYLKNRTLNINIFIKIN